MELTADGSGAIYSSLLGNSRDDAGGVAVDSSGAAYVIGTTKGSFPTTSGAYQTLNSGTWDGFITKFNAGGASLAYSTLLGGAFTDVNAIAIDPVLGDAYVTGGAGNNFPTTSGAYQTSSAGGAFVTELNSAGSGLVFSTYLTGSTSSEGYGIALARGGSVWVTGNTTDTDFPTLNPTQSTNGGGQDGFLTHLKSDGTGLLFSTYAGGNEDDTVNGVAVDSQGNAYITGVSASTNFPIAGGSSAEGAFVQKYGAAPPPPTITSISTDTGSSSTDQITTDQTPTLSGNAMPGATVTVSRSDVGVLGSVTADPSTGVWTYTSATLAQGTYAFTATQTVGGVTSDSCPDFLVTVDLTAPIVAVSVLSPTASLGPAVEVTATDNVGLPANDAVTLDVDLNNDGSYTGGELGYATGTLTNAVPSTSGSAAIALPTLPSTGTYRVRAHLADLAGNQGTSTNDTFTVIGSSTATLTQAQVLDSDPLDGNALVQLGNVQALHALDLDQSPGTAQSGNPQFVYNSRSVAVEPIVQASIQTDNSLALPSTITATLTWNGTTQSGTTYSTSGFSPGDVLTLAQQVSSPVTATGRYDWSLQVSLNYTTPITFTATSYTYVAVEDNSNPLGNGWTLSNVNQLVTLGADTTTGAGGRAGGLRHGR